MNTFLSIFLGCAVILSCTFSGTVSCQGAEEKIPAKMLDFQGILPVQALQCYKELTGAKLCIDSRAKNSIASIVCRNEKAISKDEAAKMIEKALLEQAAIVLTKLDDNRISVTFNDSLPVKPMLKD